MRLCNEQIIIPRRLAWLVCAAFVGSVFFGGWSVPLFAQSADATVSDAPITDDPTPEPEYRKTHAVPEDIVDPRPHKTTLLPSEPGHAGGNPLNRSVGAVGSIEPERRLLPESYIVAAREAEVERKGEWQIVRFKPVEGLPDTQPIRVLPNTKLAVLDTIVSSRGGLATLVLTGRISEFQGMNYILLDDIDEPRRVVTTSRPETTPASSDREPTAQEIMRRLTDKRPPKAVVMPGREVIAESKPVTDEDEQNEPGGKFAPKQIARWSEDALLVDRAGRIVPGEKWWVLAFEERSRTSGDAPIRLLPNRHLESALKISGGGTKARVIKISGEITEYKGVNYLLLRKVIVRRDMGNFR